MLEGSTPGSALQPESPSACCADQDPPCRQQAELSIYSRVSVQLRAPTHTCVHALAASSLWRYLPKLFLRVSWLVCHVKLGHACTAKHTVVAPHRSPIGGLLPRPPRRRLLRLNLLLRLLGRLASVLGQHGVEVAGALLTPPRLPRLRTLCPRALAPARKSGAVKRRSGVMPSICSVASGGATASEHCECASATQHTIASHNRKISSCSVQGVVNASDAANVCDWP